MENTFLKEAEMVLAIEENRVRKENHLKKKDSHIEFLSEPYVFLTLHVANAKNDEALREASLKILMESKPVTEVIRYRTDNYYGYYGCKELDFIYENIQKGEFQTFLWEHIREHLKKFDGTTYFFPRTASGVLDLSQKAFESRIKAGLFNFAKWSFKNMLVERCKEHGMERISANHIADYAMIRKVCDYEVDLDNTNEEIIECYKSHWKNNKKAASKEQSLSMGCKNLDEKVINRIRRGFSLEKIPAKTVSNENNIIERIDLEKAFSFLNEEQKQVLTLRYLGEKKQTYSKVGNALGISEDRARYIEKKALEILRKELEY